MPSSEGRSVGQHAPVRRELTLVLRSASGGADTSSVRQGKKRCGPCLFGGGYVQQDHGPNAKKKSSGCRAAEVRFGDRQALRPEGIAWRNGRSNSHPKPTTCLSLTWRVAQRRQGGNNLAIFSPRSVPIPYSRTPASQLGRNLPAGPYDLLGEPPGPFQEKSKPEFRVTGVSSQLGGQEGRSTRKGCRSCLVTVARVLWGTSSFISDLLRAALAIVDIGSDADHAGGAHVVGRGDFHGPRTA